MASTWPAFHHVSTPGVQGRGPVTVFFSPAKTWPGCASRHWLLGPRLCSVVAACRAVPRCGVQPPMGSCLFWSRRSVTVENTKCVYTGPHRQKIIIVTDAFRGFAVGRICSEHSVHITVSHPHSSPRQEVLMLSAISGCVRRPRAAGSWVSETRAGLCVPLSCALVSRRCGRLAPHLGPKGGTRGEMERGRNQRFRGTYVPGLGLHLLPMLARDMDNTPVGRRRRPPARDEGVENLRR